VQINIFICTEEEHPPLTRRGPTPPYQNNKVRRLWTPAPGISFDSERPKGGRFGRGRGPRPQHKGTESTGLVKPSAGAPLPPLLRRHDHRPHTRLYGSRSSHQDRLLSTVEPTYWRGTVGVESRRLPTSSRRFKLPTSATFSRAPRPRHRRVPLVSPCRALSREPSRTSTGDGHLSLGPLLDLPSDRFAPSPSTPGPARPRRGLARPLRAALGLRPSCLGPPRALVPRALGLRALVPRALRGRSFLAPLGLDRRGGPKQVSARRLAGGRPPPTPHGKRRRYGLLDALRPGWGPERVPRGFARSDQPTPGLTAGVDWCPDRANPRPATAPRGTPEILPRRLIARADF